MCRSWVKKFKGSDFKNCFVVEYFMWIFGKNIVVHFTCVSVYHCSLIELYKVPSLLLYMYSVIWKKTHVQTFNTARDFQRLTGIDWSMNNSKYCSWKRQSARSRHWSTPVSTVLRKSVRFLVIDIFLKRKTFQVARLHPRRMEQTNVLFEWLSNPGKGTKGS